MLARYPDHREFVRRWFVMIAARMQQNLLFAEEASTLAAALGLFPGDGELLLAAGSMWETLALPAVEPGRYSGATPLDVISHGDSLKKAESWLRQAVAACRTGACPDDAARGPGRGAEARMHLGRVLLLRGHPDEALAQLGAAARETADPFLLSGIALITGAAHEARGDAARARDAYQRAASLFAGVQVPHLAISHLLQKSGDREASLAALRAALSPSRPLTAPGEPWHQYRDGQAWRLPDMWEELWQEVAQ